MVGGIQEKRSNDIWFRALRVRQSSILCLPLRAGQFQIAHQLTVTARLRLVRRLPGRHGVGLVAEAAKGIPLALKFDLGTPLIARLDPADTSLESVRR